MRKHQLLILFLSVLYFSCQSGPQPLSQEKIKPDANKFFEAASKGDADTVQKMIYGGIDVNITDSSGITPLMVAAAYGQPEVARILINSGASINAEDAKGNTALDMAQHFRYDRNMAKDGKHAEVIYIIVSRQMPIRLYFPDNLNGFGDMTVTDYESKSKGLGFSFSYEYEGMNAIVYVYNFGLEKVPDGVRSSIVKNHLKIAVEDLYRLEDKGYVYGIMKVDEGIISLGKHKFLTATFNLFDQRNNMLTTHFVLCGYKNQFVKIRFSYNANMGYTGERILQKFVQSVSERLK